jgi:hypothetical protein
MARQAIVTKYLGPTNTRGARVKATAQAGSVTVPWNHEWGVDRNHAFAASELVKRYGWPSGPWVHGAAPDGSGNVYVLCPSEGEEYHGFGTD